MKRSRRKARSGRPLKVFLDSSVFFAAVLSPSGGSFRIFREAQSRNITLFVTPYVIAEVEPGLKERYPESLQSFHSFFLHFPIEILPDPRDSVTRQYVNFLPPEDAPILAAAVANRATHLLTLDKKHFLSRLKHAELPLRVLAPRDFIKDYFDEKRD